jgi:hypothetical protein
MASKVSVKVPIWLTLIRIELAIPSSIPRANFSVLVTNKSSPTNCTVLPNFSVNCLNPSQSCSSNPSSSEMIGYLAHNYSYNDTISAEVKERPSEVKSYIPVSLL